MKPFSSLRKIVPRKNRPIKISQAAKNAAINLVAPKSPKKQPFSKVRALFRPKSASRSSRKHAGEHTKPKNGWLALAVVGAVLISGVLVIANFKLVRDPAVFGKAFGTAKQLIQHKDVESTAPNSSGTLDNKAAHERPEMKFYQTLTAQDEQKIIEQHSVQIQETDIKGKRTDVNVPINPGVEKTLETNNRSQAEKSGASNQGSLKHHSAPLRYTVQVGAFSHPSIAQEWAIKWKSRGYDVFALRPVARPNTGIIYSLYLGNFPSEKQADELVKHLKAKEGISAFRLAIRN